MPYERVPVRELLHIFADKPDDFVVTTADLSGRWTVGELRELATKGQAIDLPHVLPSASLPTEAIWRTGSSTSRKLWGHKPKESRG